MSSELEDEFHKELLRAYIDSTNDAIFVLCDEMKFLLCNSAGENCLGLTEEKLVEHNKRSPITELFSDYETIDLFHQNYSRVLAGADVSFESFVKPVNAPQKWMEFTLNKVILPDIHMVVIVARDISERKELELSIKNQSAVLEKLVEERTRDLVLSNMQKDKLFSIISHDLRSPFNPIMGYAQMIMDERCDLSEEETKDYNRKILDCSTRYMDFLDTLLDWSVVQLDGVKVFRSRHNLLDVINSVVNDLFEHFSNKNIAIDVNSNIENIDVLLDKNIIVTVLRNILTNAIKFTPGGGKVSIDAQCENNECVISVADTGVGMSKKIIDEALSQNTKVTRPGTDNEKGSGLGLSICVGLLEKHQGTLQVESEEGKGSTFHINLSQAQ